MHTQTDYQIMMSVYDFLQTYLHEHGYPPNMEEISAGCHISLKAIDHALYTLEAMGYLNWRPGFQRSIRLTGQMPSTAA
jgi:SOS-response transcriptional repressor LexA